jgi:hypothetical protein
MTPLTLGAFVVGVVVGAIVGVVGGFLAVRAVAKDGGWKHDRRA